jgi:hypothetical protein
MILLHDIIEILGLTDDDRGAVLLVIALDRRFIRRTPVNGDLADPAKSEAEWATNETHR